MEHHWGKEIKLCSNEVPRDRYGLHPQGLNFYIVIYREVLKIVLLKICTKSDDIYQTYGASLGLGDSSLFK